MANLGELVLDLSLNGSQFTVGLRQATGALGQFVLGAQGANRAVNSTHSSFSAFGRLLRDTVLTLALVRDAFRTVADATVGWQKAIIDVNADMQRSIQLMKSFSKETDPVKATAQAMADVNMLLTKASNAPFSLKAITDSFVKLRVSGIEPIEQGFNALIDSVAQFGGNDEALKRASVAIQQMAGKGVVSMEELRQQLGEAVPTAIQQMANGLGVTYSKLVKEISQGKVKSEPAIIAMFREMELASSGAADRMMNTWNGAVAQLSTEFTKLMLTVGGFQEGYGEGTYMHGVTSGIRELTNILKDPSTIASAKAFGAGLTEVMNSAIDGLKWIIQYRSEIIELGKAFLTIYAATKAVTILRALTAATGTFISSLAGAGGQVRTQFANIASSFTQLSNGVMQMRSASSVATGAMTAMRGVLGTIGGIAAVATGPIGMLTAAVAAGAYSWWEYKKAAQAGIQAMIDAKGQGAGLKEIMDAQEQIKTNAKDIKSLEDDNDLATGKKTGIMGALGALSGQYIDVEGNKKKIDELKKQSAQLLDAISTGEANVIKSKANVEFEAARAAVSDGMAKVDKEYEAGMKKFSDRLSEGEKSGADKTDTFKAETKSQKLALERTRLQAQADLYNQQLDKIQKEINDKAEITSNGTVIGLDDKAVKAKVIAANQLRVSLGELGNQQTALLESSKEFSDTFLAGGGKPQKVAFDMLTIFVDGMRKKLATLDAKVEETNPYLAQLAATVESLGGVHLPNFDKMVSDGKSYAEQLFALEKAQKAVTASSNEYKDAQERISQISSLITAKLAKVETLNPWEKASADAVRYEEELVDLQTKLEETKKKAYDAQVAGSGEGLLKKLEGEAVVTAAQIDVLKAKIEDLKVSDTAKKMQEDANAISDALLTNTEKVKQQYDRQGKWADEFYANHQKQLAQDSDAMASYNAYRTQLDLQYQRDTESGLEQWIRVNKDATDQYKSLWGDAMDKFNDTLATGLTTGKFAMKDFVVYVLQELLKIQIARAMAQAASSASAAGGWLSGALSLGMAAFGGSTGANGFEAGSAAATSSSLGASQAGYSSAYKFANGGIMTEYGQLALKKYANGGVANTPQVAIYGEGKKPEAYVPLPDGRTIPVTMTGAGASSGGDGGIGSVNINITVNNDGSENTSSDSSESTLTDMAGKIRNIVRETLLTETRPGGIIDKRK
jgi:lambda family phage tail tape measure protein